MLSWQVAEFEFNTEYQVLQKIETRCSEDEKYEFKLYFLWEFLTVTDVLQAFFIS